MTSSSHPPTRLSSSSLGPTSACHVRPCPARPPPSAGSVTSSCWSTSTPSSRWRSSRNTASLRRLGNTRVWPTTPKPSAPRRLPPSPSTLWVSDDGEGSSHAPPAAGLGYCTLALSHRDVGESRSRERRSRVSCRSASVSGPLATLDGGGRSQQQQTAERKQKRFQRGNNLQDCQESPTWQVCETC